MTKYFPSKGIYLIPSTGPNIWQKQHPSSKPLALKSFHHSNILPYINFFINVNIQKCSQFFSHSFQPYNVPYHILSGDSFTHSNLLQSQTQKHFTISYSSNIYCWYFMFLIFQIGGGIGTSPWFQYVLLQSPFIQILVHSYLLHLPWNLIL